MAALIWSGVAVLGGLGAVLRFMVDRTITSRSMPAFLRFPAGTLVVNASGAALLGLLTGVALNSTAMLFAGTALLGSYTTFSTWMFETHRLAEEGQRWPAAANIVVSLASGLAAAVGGHWLAGQF